ncbi:MAG: hypothetical protein QNJ53_25550 [Pleurocapsa sp. MO_192.B19]|nr:hypothetical protein [Pleurocapsa sp. MO_192.B19]
MSSYTATRYSEYDRFARIHIVINLRSLASVSTGFYLNLLNPNSG